MKLQAKHRRMQIYMFEYSNSFNIKLNNILMRVIHKYLYLSLAFDGFIKSPYTLQRHRIWVKVCLTF